MYSEKIVQVLEKILGKYSEGIFKVLEVLDSHPGTVCAVLSGHDHEGEIVFFVGESSSIPIVLSSEIVSFGKNGPIPIFPKLPQRWQLVQRRRLAYHDAQVLRKTLKSGSSADLNNFDTHLFSQLNNNLLFSPLLVDGDGDCWATINLFEDRFGQF